MYNVIHTTEHFVIFDEGDAGDGSDNMLEGDIREKKGAATRCATSVTIFSNWSCP